MSDRARNRKHPAPGSPARAARARNLLQIWLSPAFPAGGFAYSHGLEWAVEQHWITDAASLAGWLEDLVSHGSIRNDLILLAATWRATSIGDDAGLAEVIALSAAFQPSAERYLEATQQGGSFIALVAEAWPCAAAVRVREAGCVIGYPAAIGVAAAGHAIPLAETLSAFAIAFAGALASAAIRLSVIGQTDGQRVLARLVPMLETACASAATSSIDDLGGSAFRSDVASLAHETQHTRLFRS